MMACVIDISIALAAAAPLVFFSLAVCSAAHLAPLHIKQKWLLIKSGLEKIL